MGPGDGNEIETANPDRLTGARVTSLQIERGSQGLHWGFHFGQGVRRARRARPVVRAVSA